MKFTDGNWLTREGVTIHACAEAYEVTKQESALTVYAPCQPIRHRGATLGGPAMTIRLSSPMTDVIRVEIEHFKGQVRKGPHFQITRRDCAVSIHESEDAATITSGGLSASVSKGDRWGIEFTGPMGKLTRSGWKGMAYVQHGEQSYVRELLNLDVGELVYGLGERFTPFVKNGQSVETWNRDGGTSSDQAYKTIPFYLSNKGYGVLVNHPELVDFEVGTEHVSKVQFSVAGERLEYFIISGLTPKDVLSKYTLLTGRPSLPPTWSFGLWLTTSFTTDYDESTVMHFLNGMQERDIPLSVFHFDCFWMRAFEWCNFEWDPAVFPDPVNMLSRIKERGHKVCVWLNPYIAQKSALFDECVEKGYLLKRPNGDVWQWDLWQPGMGLVDFSNPDACRWYAHHLACLMAMGVDAFKSDFGERIPLDVVYHDGSDPAKMHNYYSYLYNQVVFEALREHRGEGEAVVFARSATVGGQKFPVHWGGDCSATYASMAESLRGGLSLSLCGFGFWSHDIGGFEDSATPDLYKRWVAFGMLSSHSRLHGSSSYRVPWLFDEQAVDVLRHFSQWKNRLMPYLFAKAVEATETGIPVMRAMLLEFPFNPACEYLDKQYMLGDSLLVAPIFREDGQASYYLPDGNWTHFFSGVEVQGGVWRTEHYDYMSLPLFVRPNTLLAVGNNPQRPDYPYAQGVAFHVFALDDGATAVATVYDQHGNITLSASAHRTGKTVTVQVDGETTGPWSACLRGINRIDGVEGGHGELSDGGLRIMADAGQFTVTITL